jgi:hypothetical protein
VSRRAHGLTSGLLAAAVLLGGCQTPAAVYELAEYTSANAGTLQHHLGATAAQSKALAGRRAEHVEAMDAFNARLDAYLRRELCMRQRSLSAADWAEVSKLMKELGALRDELIAIESSAATTAGARKKEVLATQKDLDAYQASLRDTANALNALAKQESASERAKFIGKFLGEVKADIDEALKKNDKAAVAAKAGLDKVKASLKESADADSKDDNSK